MYIYSHIKCLIKPCVVKLNKIHWIVTWILSHFCSQRFKLSWTSQHYSLGIFFFFCFFVNTIWGYPCYGPHFNWEAFILKSSDSFIQLRIILIERNNFSNSRLAEKYHACGTNLDLWFGKLIVRCNNKIQNKWNSKNR